MRTIKFRGKRIDNGKWIYGDLIQWKNQKRCAITPQNGDEWKSPNDFEVDPKTVGQYIGKINNKQDEIYEGDIIEFRMYFNNYNPFREYETGDVDVFDTTFSGVLSLTPSKGAVINRVKRFCNLSETIGEDKYPRSVPMSKADKLGNIYDNPELLKPQK